MEGTLRIVHRDGTTQEIQGDILELKRLRSRVDWVRNQLQPVLVSHRVGDRLEVVLASTVASMEELPLEMSGEMLI